MGRRARLKCAEKQLAVWPSGSNGPARADADVRHQVVASHEARRIAGQEQRCLRDIIHVPDNLHDEADYRKLAALDKTDFPVSFLRFICKRCTTQERLGHRSEQDAVVSWPGKDHVHFRTRV
jgi:hypothetical protein